MLFKQLLGLAFSTLIGVTPISHEVISYPNTKWLAAYGIMTYEVFDLGFHTYAAAAENTSVHDYVIAYTFDVSCNQTCTLANGAEHGYNINESQVVYHLNRRFQCTADELYSTLGTIRSRAASLSIEHTFSSSTEFDAEPLTFSTGGYDVTFTVVFPAETTGSLLEEFKTEYELVNEEQLIYQLVLNKDVNSVFKHQVLTLLENGDVDGAYNLVQNYYINNSVTETEYNETVINQYQSKETDLQTVTDTEHNFTIDIEDDFNDQIQAIDTENSVISNSNFQQSALWVTDKFNRFTVNNAFGSILGFSLLLGLAMAIIGRVIK